MPPYLLVVESDPDLQRRIGETLREASYELSMEADGAWAKRSLLVRPPDGVVLNTSLSDGSGFAVADALRTDPDTQHVPIFFVASTHRGAAHGTEARRRFAPAEYFATPLNVDTLLAHVLERLPPKPPVDATDIPHYPIGKLTDTAQRRERREVEATARELRARAPSIRPRMRGSLGREPFARLLQRIYAERLSGALLLEQGQTKKIIYFGDGYPVSVRSNVLSECLGQILLARRLISRQALEESLRRMHAEKRQQGQILVEMGALSPHNLGRALVAQMEHKLFEVFAWRGGSFSFNEGKPPPGEAVRLERTPAAIILEGIRRHYDADRRDAVLASFAGHYFAPSGDPLRRLQDMTADPAERRFIESLDGSKRLEAVIASSPIAPEEARLLLVAMAEAGMIEPARAPARRGGPEEAMRVTAADPETPQVRRPEERSPDELHALFEVMHAQTCFEALGVGEDATAAEVDRAYEARARDFHPDRFRFRPEQVRQIARKIFDHLRDARSTLRETTRRRRYLAKLERERAEQSVSAFAAAPTVAEKVYYAGIEHLRARRFHEAVQALQQAIQLAPAQASYHGALGWAMFRASPADAAAIEAGLAELRRAVEMNGKDPWVRISLGRFYAETGRPDQAIAEFEAALRLNPGLTEMQEEIRRLRREA
jgi:tetratricopeptide (TPR) repeat protein/ActR/RegA family two-component response regulator